MVGATLSQEELSDSAFSYCVLGNCERHTGRQNRPKNLRKYPPLGKPQSWPKMAKNHGATFNFTNANPPLMLAPRNLDHFHNIQRTLLLVMGISREECELPWDPSN